MKLIPVYVREGSGVHPISNPGLASKGSANKSVEVSGDDCGRALGSPEKPLHRVIPARMNPAMPTVFDDGRIVDVDSPAVMPPSKMGEQIQTI